MKIQKRSGLAVLVVVLSLIGLSPVHILAATTAVTGGTNGPLCNSGGYFTPASVTIASGDTITFSVPANDPYAGGVQINGFPQGSFVVPRGSSVTTQVLTGNVSYQGTWPNSLSCIKGSGTITVQTTTNSTGTPSPSPAPPSSTSNTSTNTSTTTPSVAPTSTTKSTSTSTKSTPSTAPTGAQTMAAPETVVANTISVDGNKITSMATFSIKPSQVMQLSGTTVPNGKITLTIHSNPTTATVQADASGNWKYTVTGLPSGFHTIYATVTDPVTGKTSSQAKLLSFTVDATPLASTTHPSSAHAMKSSNLPVLSAVGVVALLLVAVTVILWRKKHASAGMLPLTAPSVAPANSLPAQSIQLSNTPLSSTSEPSVINQEGNHKEDKS